jgi:selenocysteine-specific elongation factor
MPHPLVVGTAGHVDHGKTSLVKALTGVDLDSLPEERARGITIALGFTPLPLPGGRVAGLVDVPGHERLVRTMAAGASGMDAVMLCVAADDGAMPQTREHLAILGLLGVRTGVLVLTKADLVDAETLELVEADLRETVAGSFLEGAPCVATSAATGLGLDALRATLAEVTAGARARRTDLPFRMPVDRAFLRRGFGTVVTGTAWEGVLEDGTEVELAPAGVRARVRGVQVHGSAVPRAEAGARAALNLAGVSLGEAGRGCWVTLPRDSTPGAPVDGLLVDVAWTHLADAPAFPREVELLVLHGTREVVAHVASWSEEGLVPGRGCYAQLRLAEPLPCRPGDRFVARRPSPATTVGGGVIVDPWAPRLRKRDRAATLPLLDRLVAGDADAWLDRAGPAGLPERDCLDRGVRGGVRLGERRYAAHVVADLGEALRDNLRAWHAAHPLALGPNRRALRSGRVAALSERDAAALLEHEVAAGRVCGDASRAWMPGFEVRLTPAQQAWVARAGDLVRAAGLEGVGDLPAALPHPDATELAYLMRDRGELVEVAGGGQPARLYAPEVLAGLRRDVDAWFTARRASGGPVELDPASFKELSGQTRRTAIPLLEWLDSVGSTRRRGDVRIPGG